MERTQRILVVDDDPMVRDVVRRYLEDAGYAVTEAGDGVQALAEVDQDAPDLIVLDVMIPGPDGLSVLRDVRRDRDVPVILLTARNEEVDRISGLEFGADDYVVKPFSPRELVARVRTVLRRAAPSTNITPLEFGPLRIEPASRTVTTDGRNVELTRLEFDLLHFMASSPNRVYSRSELLEHVWDSSAEWQDPSTVTVHVRRLRAKFEPDPEAPRWIRTVWGVGYRFEP